MKVAIIWILALAAFLGLAGFYCTSFPGASRPALSPMTGELEDTADRLRAHVRYLAEDVGLRRGPTGLGAAASYLESKLKSAGVEVARLESSVPGAPTLLVSTPGLKHKDEVLIVCAHYDAPAGSPGADANASGCAVLVEVASILALSPRERCVRYVLFPDGASRAEGYEGSSAARYAKSCAESGERVVGVINLDSVGTYEPSAPQRYPFPLAYAYPEKADFLGVVGSLGARNLTERTVEQLRKHSSLPVSGLSLPSFLPGAGFSDHAAFWDEGIPAVTVTTTGSWRSAHWGTASDTPDRLDYDRMARFAQGLARAIGFLVKKATLT